MGEEPKLKRIVEDAVNRGSKWVILSCPYRKLRAHQTTIRLAGRLGPSGRVLDDTGGRIVAEFGVEELQRWLSRIEFRD